MSAMISWSRFIHILAALWLVGGLFAGPVVRAQIKRSKDLAGKAFGLRLAWRLCAVFVLPGLLLSGLVGFHLIGARQYSFSMPWIHISMALWTVMLVVFYGYVAPATRRAARAAEEAVAAGGSSPGLERALGAKLPGILWDVTALGAVILTVLMVFKPV